MNIKDYIISNFKDDNQETLEKSIVESIKTNDEIALPGLGVFFELLWKSSTADEKKTILSKLITQIKK